MSVNSVLPAVLSPSKLVKFIVIVLANKISEIKKIFTSFPETRFVAKKREIIENANKLILSNADTLSTKKKGG